MKTFKISIKDLTLMSIMLAILIISSKIVIPIGPISITMQTFAVIIISLILGMYKTTIVISLYIILGLIGLPVFASGGGFQYIFMPSFGYIIGFLFEGAIVSIASKSSKRYLKYLLGILGLLVDYILGTIYFAFIMMNNGAPKDLLYILNVCVFPFVIKDVISVFIASIIYSRIKDYLVFEDDIKEINYNEIKEEN